LSKGLSLSKDDRYTSERAAIRTWVVNHPDSARPRYQRRLATA
jgi:hypothetical protein